MNPAKPDFERVEDQAATWAARLRGGAMTDSDRERLAAWLGQDSEHQAALARYRELTAVLDAGYTAPAEAAPTRRRSFWRTASVVALGAAAAIVLALALSGPEKFTTGTAERRVVALPDGSRLELNARSEVRVEIHRGTRHVSLAAGEALFSVAKDPGRPFTVETPTGRIEVTGTVFAVRADRKDATEVTVLEGQVRVSPQADAAVTPVTLDPGRQATIRPTQLATRTLEPAAIENVVAWRHGQVVFENSPLSDVLARFAPYETRTLSVAAEAADLRLGGRFSLDDFDGALAFIERVLPVTVVREAGVVRLEATRPAR